MKNTTNKDVIFWLLIMIWSISDIILYFLIDDKALMFSNITGISILIILVLFKTYNIKFYNWLHKKI